MWLTLPEAFDAETLFPLALDEGVAYIPGPAFSPSGRFRNSLRLCFASSDRDRTLLGVRRLRLALDRAAGEA
jgi:2-aminoadipate transaminase